MGCHALLQGVFPTQGLNMGLPHCSQILCHLSHQGSLFSLRVLILLGFKEEMATHSSILAWKVSWTEESGGLQSMGCKELDMTEQLSPCKSMYVREQCMICIKTDISKASIIEREKCSKIHSRRYISFT